MSLEVGEEKPIETQSPWKKESVYALISLSGAPGKDCRWPLVAESCPWLTAGKKIGISVLQL